MLKVAGFIEQANGTITQINTGTGLTGGPITTSGTISLANTTVTAGTYGNASSVAQVTIDAQGRITSASNVTISAPPGGNTTEFQYNNAGTLAGLSTFTTDGTNVVLSTNSATNALRITQIGAGNALVVEDDTNPDASPFIVDSTGRVLVGTTTAAGRLTVYDASSATAFIQGDSTAQFVIQRSSADSTQSAMFFRKSRGTVAAPAAVSSGDNLGFINFSGYGGTTFRILSSVRGGVDTYTSDTDISSYLTFATSPSGSATPTERMRVTSAGDLLVGTTSNSNSSRLHLSAGGNSRMLQLTGTDVDSSAGMGLTNDAVAWNFSLRGDSSDSLIFRNITAGVDAVTFTTGGNVGIGTSSPVNKLQVVGSFGRGAPVTKTGNFTLADTENWVICNGTGTITVTFPAASSWTGREVMIKTIAAQTVVSASSNVVPRNSATAGTAILSATAGQWATLVSNGTDWVIMAGS